MTAPTFGRHLRDERRRLGLVARDVANALGVPPSTVYALERDVRRPPAADVVERLGVLGVDVAGLLERALHGGRLPLSPSTCAQCGHAAMHAPSWTSTCADCRRRNGWAVDALLAAAASLRDVELEQLAARDCMAPTWAERRHGLDRRELAELAAAAAPLQAAARRVARGTGITALQEAPRKGPQRATRPVAAAERAGRSC